jgi:hypothetical protein
MAWDHPHMAEYGQGVAQGSGLTGGGSGGGGGTLDVGQAAAGFVNDTVATLSALPPWALVALVVAIILGFILLKRAF